MILADVAVATASSTAVGVLLNYTAATFLSHRIIYGSPQWSWYISLFMQILVFPAILIAGWAPNGFNEEWLNRSWEQILQQSNPYPPELVFHCVGIAYMVKDLFIMDDMKLVVHHVACIVAFLIDMFFLDAGANRCAYVATLLEFGSVFLGVYRLFPDYWLFRNMYFTVFGMTVMNSWAFYVFWELAIHHHIGFGLAVQLIMCSGIMITRQIVCTIEFYQLNYLDKSKKKD